MFALIARCAFAAFTTSNVMENFTRVRNLMSAPSATENLLVAMRWLVIPRGPVDVRDDDLAWVALPMATNWTMEWSILMIQPCLAWLTTTEMKTS